MSLSGCGRSQSGLVDTPSGVEVGLWSVRPGMADHHAHYLQVVGGQVGDLGMRLDAFSYLRPNTVSPLRVKNAS